MAGDEQRASSHEQQEPFVMLEGPKPSEAEHIYDHFYSEYASNGYDAILIQQIKARRSRPELQGVLFYDELLNQSEIAASAYPPQEGKDGLIQLVERILSVTSIDRIQRMSLLFYLLLDLDTYNGTQSATVRFAKRVSLPRSARHAITGYWHLDNALYRKAVSYLEQPQFVPRILSILSPVPAANASEGEVRERAFAFASFVKTLEPEKLDPSVDVKQAMIVSKCYTEGVYAAWSLSRDAVEEQDFATGVARIVEYCFMPQSKPKDVQALISLPISQREELLLAHTIVNPPPNISLSALAHTTAIDTLLIRHINSGQYVDAVLLDRKVSSSLSLLHLTSEAASTEADREKVRRLRAKRQAIVKAAFSVLTDVEKELLEIGDGTKAGQADEDEIGSESSWERVANPSNSAPAAADVSTLSEAAGPSQFSSLTSSPVLRKMRQTKSDRFANPLLATIAKERLSRTLRSPSARLSVGADSPFNLSIDESSATPLGREEQGSTPDLPSARPLADTSLIGDMSVLSPIASARPYQLSSYTHSAGTDAPFSAQDASMLVDEDVESPAAEVTRQTESPSSMGPMAKLAQQLEEEMKRNRGAVDEILRKTSSSRPSHQSPFRIPSGTPSKNAHATLTLARAPRKYQATYELNSQEDGVDRHGDSSMGNANKESSAPAEVAQRRRQIRRAPPAHARLRQASGVAGRGRNQEHDMEEDNDGDTSVPGSFPVDEQEAVVTQHPSAARTKDKPKAPREARKAAKQTAAIQSHDYAQEEETADVVPEMKEIKSLSKSRSATGGVKARSKTASTPLRRSTRLSVEPESRDGVDEAAGQDDDDNEDEEEQPSRRQKGTRTTGKGSAKTKAKKGADTNPNARTRRRGTSKAPSDAGEERETAAPALKVTRSSSRLKVTSGDEDETTIPGSF